MSEAARISQALAARAEAVCRRYLPYGRRQGRYWTCGDLHGNKGGSLYVRLAPPGPRGKWADSASGEHGDLLDLIRHRSHAASLGEALAEARRFLSLPEPPAPARAPAAGIDAAKDRASGHARGRAAARLWARARPFAGSPAEAYLRARAIPTADIPAGQLAAALRYHPGCWLREHDDAPRRALPAMLAAIAAAPPPGPPPGPREAAATKSGVTALHRVWLDPARPALAAIARPKRSLGAHLGLAVWFGRPRDALLAGEGIETVLSLKAAWPERPMAAALSAGHLGALELPAGLRRLVIARDPGRAGARGAAALRERARAAGIEVRVIAPLLEASSDFNDDLQALGREVFAERMRRTEAGEVWISTVT